MANDPHDWPVSLHPAPPYDFFISHAAEDFEDVKKLKAEISGRSGRGGGSGLTCFLDLHDWRIGCDNRLEIRENLWKSRFMIAWITKSYLKNPRGWVWFQLCHAELLELSLKTPGIEFPYIVPIFRSLKIQQVQRSPLLLYWQRGMNLCKPDLDPGIENVAQRIIEFHAQEMKRRPIAPLTKQF